MTRQHRDAVEQPLRGGVRLRQIDLNRVLIELPHGDRLPSDDQQIALRRRHLLVQVDLKREQHIVGVERIAIGETNAAAQRQREPAAIGRDRPRPRQGGFGLLRFAVDMNQVRHRAPDDVPRRTIDRDDGIERSRLGALNDHQLAAGAAHLRTGDQPLDAAAWRLLASARPAAATDRRPAGPARRVSPANRLFMILEPQMRVVPTQRHSENAGRSLMQRISQRVVQQKHGNQRQSRDEHPPI